MTGARCFFAPRQTLEETMSNTAAKSGTALRHARHKLIEHGDVPAGLIDEVVARSWRRCLADGLAPTGRLADVPHLSAADVARAIEREHELIAHARPVMEYVFSQTRNSGSMVVVADRRGVLLHAQGDASFLARANRVLLAPGASWHEQYRGTNAIGTALVEAAPVVVHAAEHYLERNGFLTCASAPIAAPDGRVLGVLDISGDHRSRHPHTFSLVRAAAQMIENRLFDARHGDSMRLRFHPLDEGIGTVAEGVAAISEDGWIVGANQAGLALLGLAPADLGATSLSRVLQTPLGALIDWGARRPGQSQLIDTVKKGRLFVRVEMGRRALVFEAPRQPAPQPQPRQEEAKPDALRRLDTGDPLLARAIERARRVLGKPIPVLIQGESGVGKELFARALHDAGPRAAKPFVALNCSALPEHLIEAELFGYENGAFTGARRNGSPGRIREAHGGTLFLDEIGDMPLNLQARLLRTLQERKVTPLGAGRQIEVDFVLLCATHRDLKAEVEAGRFRMDLYYRINSLTLHLPALREREDFAALTAQLLEQAAPGRALSLQPGLMQSFRDYRWPGNLRQLANAIQTACALLPEDRDAIGFDDLSEDLAQELGRLGESPSQVEHTDNLRVLTDSAIEHAIRAAGGNMSDAARRLGISRNTLYRRRRLR
jgi:transcriptional regulator of acetoin/glycerol metabolism